jgi:hypothetical protein
MARSGAAFFLLALEVGVLVVPTSRGAELFAGASVNVQVGQDPSGIALADLNGDGRADLAVTNRLGNSVSVLLGDGLGAFSSTPDISVGAGPEAVTVADFNADGHTDLAVVNRDADSVTVLLGDGSGSFSHNPDVLVGASPVAIAATELSGDRHIDLVVVNRDSDSVSVLLGDGSGGFLQASNVGVGAAPLAVTTGHFNADVKPDLAVVNNGGDSLSVLLGDGSGGFSQTPEVAVGAGPEAVAAGEFNGDGHPDLAVANHDADTISILLGSAQGEFVLSSFVDVGDGPAALTVSDLNNDGATDLAVANPAIGTATVGGEGSVTILLGDLSGGFLRTPDIETAQHPPSLAAGDFDNDGAPDLAVVYGDSASVGVLLGNGLGSVSQTPNFDVSNGPRSLATGEFNADGVLDLAVGNFASISEGSVDILVGDGSGGFLFDPEASLDIGVGPVTIAIGDLDGNGLGDLVFGDVISGKVSVMLGDGESGFVPMPGIVLGGATSSFAFGYFNTDSAQDIVAVDFLSGAVSILLGDGAGNLAGSPAIRVGNGPVSAAVADLNGDGVADIAVANLFSNTVSLLLGSGDGSFTRTANFAAGPDPYSIAAGDFDADGHADFAVANHGGDSVSVFFGDGSGSFSAADYGVGREPSYVAVADFNNDGVADLIVTNELGDSVSVLLSNGLGGFLRIPDITVRDRPVSVAVGDFDADGGVDAAVANRDGDSISTLHNQLSDRADVNGSNRIDGFDVAAIGLSAALRSSDPSYERNVDVDLNGIVDGDDLDVVAARFGELREVASPLRASVPSPMPPDPDTVTFQQLSAEGDLLTIRILVNDTDDPVTGADFAVTYGPADGDPSQVLELLDNFTPGSYLRGDFGQIFSLDRATPGEVAVAASRVPVRDQAGSGQQSLMDLVFRAVREGEAELDFAPVQYSRATLLNAAEQEVPGVTFVGPVSVAVEATGEDPVAQRIGVVPQRLDFGTLSLGMTTSRTLKISNFGFSDVDVVDVASTVSDFSSFFGSTFTISEFGFTELTVEYSAQGAGLFAGELVIDLRGPGDVEVRVPVLGRAGLELTAVPSHLDFSGLSLGDERTERVVLTNTGDTPLNLTSVMSERPDFEPLVELSALPPGQSRVMEVRFRPLTTGEVHGLLHLSFDAPRQATAVLSLSGRGL